MNKKQAEQKQISINWWNMGKKTLDHNGTYKEFLDKKDIKVNTIKHPFTEDKGYRFKLSLSSTLIKIDTFDYDYIRNMDKAIIHFLTELGDKTIFINGYRQEYKINWR